MIYDIYIDHHGCIAYAECDNIYYVVSDDHMQPINPKDPTNYEITKTHNNASKFITTVSICPVIPWSLSVLF